MVLPYAVEAAQLPLWEIGAGAGAVSIPDYRGSDERHTYILPIPYVIYRGESLIIDRQRVRGMLFKGETINVDVSLNASVPVNSDDSEARRGMPDLDPTAEIGPSLEVLLYQNKLDNLKATLQLPVRQVIATDFSRLQSAGWVFNPKINLSQGNPSGWNYGFSFGPLFATRRNHAYFYNVETQYASVDRPVYEARGGYSGSEATVSISRRFDKLWLGAFIRAAYLGGAKFADSPLVKIDSHITAGFGLAWIFAQSSKKVEADE